MEDSDFGRLDDQLVPLMSYSRDVEMTGRIAQCPS